MLAISSNSRKARIRLILIGLILLVSFLPPLSLKLASSAYAGYFTAASVTISDSRAAQSSVTYDFAFTATVTTNIKQIDIKFCTEQGAFADTCSAPSGFSVSGATRATDNIAGTGRTDSQPGANQWRTVITTPASQATQAITFQLTGVTNPTGPNVTVYPRVSTWSDTGTTQIDYANIAFAVLTSTSIAVSASVDPTFTFTVAAVSSGGTVNSNTTDVTTTASTIPFGTLADGTAKQAANDVTIATNAGGGYIVTGKAAADPPLTSGSNNIDKFNNTPGTPATWSAPAGTSGSVNTGFFGMTTEDTDLSGYGSNKWEGVSTTARNLLSQSGPVSGGTETVRVGWQAEVNEIQPPGSYTGTVILVATPTY